MPTIPESEKNVNDLVDVVLESWKEPTLVETEDGRVRVERIINSKRAYWQSHHIASNQLGSLANHLEDLGNLFRSAKYHMTANRAAVFEKLGLMFVDQKYLAIDAKSSESVKDAHNNHMTLLNLLAKVKMEKQFNVKQEMNKSILDSLTGKKVDEHARS